MFLLATLLACAASSPFQGPGLTDDGTLAPGLEGPFTIAITHAVPNKEKVDEFDAHVESIEDQLLRAEGFVAYSLRGEVGGRDRWTMTVWESEQAMVDFMTSEDHLVAMGRSHLLLDEIDSATWQERDRDAVPPRWKDALPHLEEEPS